jgi:hypothetical protein
LHPFFDQTDKHPFFDGHIYVYSDLIQNNTSYKGRIPVQIKSKTVLSINHEISYKFNINKSNLEAYLKEGGIIFFLVLLFKNQDKTRVFYNDLLPFKIFKFLNKCKKNKSITIKFRPFPTDPNSIYDLTRNFLNHSAKQSILKQIDYDKYSQLSSNSLMSKFRIDLTSFFSFDAAIDTLFTETYIYSEINSDFVIPIELIGDDDTKLLKLTSTLNIDVIIRDTKFFSTVTIDRYKDFQLFKFGKGIELSIPHTNDNNKKFRLTYILSGTISDMSYDIEFLYAINKFKSFVIANTTFSFENGFLGTSFENSLIQNQLFVNTLKAAGVHNDIDINTFNNQDINCIYTIHDSLVNSKEISLPFKIDFNVGNIISSLFKIANLSIVLLIQKSSINSYKLYNPFNNILECKNFSKFERSDQIFRTTFYYFLLDYNILELSNLDLDAVYEDIVTIGVNKANLQIAGDILFKVLFALDQGKNNRPDFLRFARQISEWIYAHEECKAKLYAELNVLQVIRRERELTDEEKLRICSIIEKNHTNAYILTGAYILLENFQLAEQHFDLLNDADQNRIKNLPIFNLWSKS